MARAKIYCLVRLSDNFETGEAVYTFMKTRSSNM